ncbi:MAG: glycosyltransferase [Alphaproteobacteria bacterium]|nr:glycosyltransferase [Alphaproteobacteria bacterium]
MGIVTVGIGFIAVLAWVYLILFRGRFWRPTEGLDEHRPARAAWPRVTAIIPARNEAEMIGVTIRSIAAMDYPGPFDVILVDDGSIDGTADAARAAIGDNDGNRFSEARIEILGGSDLPLGWAGKLWAMRCGVEHAAARPDRADYYLFFDADIVHDRHVLRRLVDKAEGDDLDMVSQMVMLSAKGFWEALLVPAFVFFFAKLYPFAWVNRDDKSTAAAAGGCMLVRRGALERAGGLAAIRDRLIDDCALAGLIKARGREGPGRIWLGWTAKSRSIRDYGGLGGVWQMVARTAYTQLEYRPLMLAGTLIGLALVYLAGPVLLALPLHGSTAAAILGAVAYAMSAASFVPHLRHYRRAPAYALLLPLAALLYAGMTIASALAYYRGRGGAWKGRFAGAAGELEGRT